ncbi:MAG TPA: efflux RND transporter periplasmic adaptor subunit [Thermoanaerobaculia bacterium]|nr:efflux RND transporter periplasmic adaptor subunit [Thermoanaerobaculia bacterium]
MKPSVRKILPWAVAAVFAVAFLATVLRNGKGAVAGPSASAPPSTSPAPADRKVLYWVDPMHPAYKSDKPGIAPDCGMELVPVYADASASAPAPSIEGYASLNLPRDRQQAIGVAVGTVERRELAKTLRAVGRVTFDERLLHRIHAKFEGYVETLRVDYTGRPVRKGEPLLSIYSPDLLATQQEYLLAYRAKKDLARSGNTDVARGALDLYESARQRLLLWDIPAAEIARLERTGQPQKALTLVSPVAGIVTAKNVVQGARVMPADSLFEISDLSRVWVLADVYESEAPFVRVGQSARMALSYLPGREWTGKVTFIAPVVKPETRTVEVRLEFTNPDGTLKPEMFADVVLERSLGRVVAVPEAAVLSTGTRSIVFVSKGDGSFEPREVEAGTKAEGFWEIRRGLEPGEKVVTQANFLIDSESRLKAALAGLAPPPGGHEGHSGASPSGTRVGAPQSAAPTRKSGTAPSSAVASPGAGLPAGRGSAPPAAPTADPHAGHASQPAPTADPHAGHGSAPPAAPTADPHAEHAPRLAPTPDNSGHSH